MADNISFACPGCGQELEAPPELAGMETECPSCGQAMIVPGDEQAPIDASPELAPAPEASEPEADTPAPMQEESIPDDVAEPGPALCPECGSELADGAVLCVNCGFHVKLGKKIGTEFS